MYQSSEQTACGTLNRYAKDTYTHMTRGMASLFMGARAMCPDGIVRNVKRIASTADTFFSVPASVSVYRNGKHVTVAGYITFTTVSGSSVETLDDPAYVEFRPYTYRKNGKIFEKDA